ncbi:MAG: hypothetical protein ACI91B_001342 [Planctomycetota bacterium]|jgi:hypothetical protein
MTQLFGRAPQLGSPRAFRNAKRVGGVEAVEVAQQLDLSMRLGPRDYSFHDGAVQLFAGGDLVARQCRARLGRTQLARFEAPFLAVVLAS